MTDRLSAFGYSFQVKVITSLLTSKTFLQRISDILEPKYFESEANQWIVNTILEYQKEYRDSPSLDVLKVQLDNEDNDVLKESVVSHLRDAWKYTDSNDLEYIKDKALDFCKNQEIKKAILKSVEMLKDGNYDGIKVAVDDAMKAGADEEIGHDYLSSMEERYSESVRYPLETPWEVINDLTSGGLGKGELGVMVAPAGIGKSWALMNVGAHAVKEGYTVLHYTLELNEAYVGLRYDSVITGIANQNLRHYKEDIKAELEKLEGELVIKHFPTKSVSVMGVRAHVEKCIMQGKKPDMIIVDYADLLRGTGTEKRHELEGIYEELRGMAGEYEIPVWTASQANRSSLEEDVIDASKVSESYGKVMVADFILSLSRKIKDKMAGTGRWHVIKNRFGPDGITLPSKMNTSNGQFDIYTDTSIDGKAAKHDMQDGNEMVRQLLSNSYRDLMNTGGSEFE